MNELARLADLHGTDKLWHGYCPYYERHLPPRNEEFSLLEIGIKNGASLRMWRDFFPNASIYGIDIDKRSMFQEERITTILGDGTSREFLDKLDIPNLRVIVDDGSHKASDVMKTFQALWRRLDAGDWYVIEDLRVQWEPRYEGTKDGSPVIRMLEGFMHDTLRSEIDTTMELHLYTEIAFLRRQ